MSFQYYELFPNFTYSGSRNDIRMQVVYEFSKELPGKGNEEKASRYKYYVETLSTGERIYLQRPASLHNGFDFLICVENADYAKRGKKKRNYPKHEDIKKDLLKKRREEPVVYTRFYKMLKQLYECKDIDYEKLNKLKFSSGLPADHIAKVIKWFFIEQDIRYWNYSGRDMIWGIIPQPKK